MNPIVCPHGDTSGECRFCQMLEQHSQKTPSEQYSDREEERALWQSQMFDPQEPASQPLSSSGEEQDDEEDDVVESNDPPAVTRRRIAVKRPASSSNVRRMLDLEAEEDGSDLDQEIGKHHRKYLKEFAHALLCKEAYEGKPDLETYFCHFDIADHVKIALCRTYANYLAQKIRSAQPMNLQSKRDYKRKK